MEPVSSAQPARADGSAAAELPDYTVATTEFDRFTKDDGVWYDHYAYPSFSSDEEFFGEHPDAVVVALPTATPMTRAGWAKHERQECHCGHRWDEHNPDDFEALCLEATCDCGAYELS